MSTDRNVTQSDTIERWLTCCSLVFLLSSFSAALLLFSVRAEQPETLKILIMAIGSAGSVLTIFLTDTALDKLWRLRWYLLPFLTFGGIMFLSRWWSAYPALAWNEMPSLAVPGLFLLAVVVQPRPDRLFRFVAATVTGIVLLSGMYGLAQKAGWDLVLWIEHRDRIFSTFGNPNIFSSFLLFSIPLLCVVLSGQSTKWLKSAAAMALPVSIVMLLWASSRGAWLILLCVTPVFLFRAFRSVAWRKVLTIAFLLMMLVPFVFPSQTMQVGDRFMSLFDPDGPSIQSRLMMYRSAVKAIGEKPLHGWGLGTVPAVFPLFHRPELYELPPFNQMRSVKHVHSEYLEVTLETGLMGLLALLACCMTVIHAWRRRTDPHQSPLLTAVLVGVGMVAVQAAFSVSSRFITTRVLICMGCSLIIRGALTDEGPGRENIGVPQYVRRIARTVIFVILCGISAFSLQSAFNTYRASCLLKQAKTMVAQKRLDEAQRLLLAAIDREPHSAELFQNLGAVLLSRGEYRAATASFEHVLMLNPHHTHTHYNLALIAVRHGDYGRAIGLLEQAERWRPRSWLIEELFGDVSAKLGNIQQARDRYIRARRLNLAESRRYRVILDGLDARIETPAD